jgi:hypothetical protein
VTDSFHPRVLSIAPGEQALHIWKEDPAFGGGPEGYFLNGIALDGDDLYVSLVTAAPYLLHVGIKADGSAGAVDKVQMPRMLKNADAIRSYAPKHLAIFESNAMGKDGPYGGQISLADLSRQPLALKTVAGGLNDPSSGLILGKRLYFIESKYGLLFQHKDDPANVPAGVPFAVQSFIMTE